MYCGTTFQGRWVIERVLGRGGMGGVYLAMDERLKRRVAIKAMPPGGHLEREARLLAQLDHPHIVKVLDYLNCGSNQYMIMDYIEGRNLDTVLSDPEESLATARVLHWAKQILDALEYLHGHAPTVVFRDLKPANVMLHGDESVSLVDFGIARLCEPGVTTASVLQNVGTPGFAPVEQYYGVTNDTRSDIYALGATLYALLTRQAPPPSVAIMSGDQPLVPLRTLRPDVSHEQESAILRMLAVRKEDRPQTVGEARTALFSGSASELEPFDPDFDRTAMASGGVASTVLPFAHPCSILYQGAQDSARRVFEHARRVGLVSHLLHHVDPTLPHVPGWMVVVQHEFSRG